MAIVAARTNGAGSFGTAAPARPVAPAPVTTAPRSPVPAGFPTSQLYQTVSGQVWRYNPQTATWFQAGAPPAASTAPIATRIGIVTAPAPVRAPAPSPAPSPVFLGTTRPVYAPSVSSAPSQATSLGVQVSAPALPPPSPLSGSAVQTSIFTPTHTTAAILQQTSTPDYIAPENLGSLPQPNVTAVPTQAGEQVPVTPAPSFLGLQSNTLWIALALVAAVIIWLVME